MFLDSEIIAQISRSPAELSEEQLIRFGELEEVARIADETTRARAFVSGFILNESRRRLWLNQA